MDFKEKDLINYGLIGAVLLVGFWAIMPGGQATIKHYTTPHANMAQSSCGCGK